MKFKDLYNKVTGKKESFLYRAVVDDRETRWFKSKDDATQAGKNLQRRIGGKSMKIEQKKGDVERKGLNSFEK